MNLNFSITYIPLGIKFIPFFFPPRGVVGLEGGDGAKGFISAYYLLVMPSHYIMVAKKTN